MRQSLVLYLSCALFALSALMLWKSLSWDPLEKVGLSLDEIGEDGVVIGNGERRLLSLVRREDRTHIWFYGLSGEWWGTTTLIDDQERSEGEVRHYEVEGRKVAVWWGPSGEMVAKDGDTQEEVHRVDWMDRLD